MNAAAAHFRAPQRGAHLILEHCAVLEELTGEHRTPAAERLAERIGGELATRLVSALAGSYGRRYRGV